MGARTEKKEKRGRRVSGGQCQAASCLPALAEYRQLRQTLAESERRLGEYCAAVEDFDLHPGSPALADPRPIHCSTGDLTPAELLACAEAEAVRTEALTEAVEAARRRAQTCLLQQSRDAAEYQVLCRRYLEEAAGQ